MIPIFFNNDLSIVFNDVYDMQLNINIICHTNLFHGLSKLFKYVKQVFLKSLMWNSSKKFFQICI